MTFILSNFNMNDKLICSGILVHHSVQKLPYSQIWIIYVYVLRVDMHLLPKLSYVASFILIYISARAATEIQENGIVNGWNGYHER